MRKRKTFFLCAASFAAAGSVLLGCLLSACSTQENVELFGTPSGRIVWETKMEYGPPGDLIYLYDCKQNKLFSLDNAETQLREISFCPGEPDKLFGVRYFQEEGRNQFCTTPIESGSGTLSFGACSSEYSGLDAETAGVAETPRFIKGTGWASFVADGCYKVYQPESEKTTVLADAEVLSVEFLSKGSLLYGAVHQESKSLRTNRKNTALTTVTRMDTQSNSTQLLLRNISDLKISNNKRYLSYRTALHPGSICVYDLETNLQTAVVMVEPADDEAAGWTDHHIVSPDGQYLAYASKSGITLVNLQNNAKQEIQAPKEIGTLDWADNNDINNAIDQIH